MPYFRWRFLERLQRHFRAMRAERFRRLLQPTPENRILDLGGGDGSYLASVVPFRQNVWIADTDPRVLARAAAAGFRTVAVTPGRPLPFADGFFDIVHCNSVIEHVYGDGQREQFVGELRRLARRYFVQTPNKYFPIEPHTCLPGAQFLPPALLHWLRHRIGPWWGGMALRWQLLGARELRAWFPEATLVRERCLGFTKSLIAVGGSDGEVTTP
jgi:SAM-dependent methyltransferase